MRADASAAGPAGRRRAVFKAALLAGFVAASITVVRFTPVKDHLTAEAAGRLLEAAGHWAPAAYVLLYAVGVCLFVPGSVLTGIGAVIFGAYWGFVYVWIGAMIGACAAFFIGRTLGREFAAGLVGERLRKYDDAIARNGFATVLYLRLVYFPFTPMNFGMGLTRVKFRDYALGTALGILVGTFIFTFFIGNLKTVWVSGRREDLWSAPMLLSLALFVFSFFIPAVVRRFRKSPERAGEPPS